MAPKDGEERTTACFWQKMKAGNTLYSNPQIRRMNWGVKRFSIPSEGTSHSQSGSDCRNSTLTINLKLKTFTNIMQSGSGKEN
jgi:hypothetical protein